MPLLAPSVTAATDRSGRSTSGHHNASLDGVRVLAVYAVVLFHAGLPWAAGGFIGVDVFFVLSGLVVTASLLRTFDRTGAFDLPRFFARRVRRLLPASLLLIATVAVVGPHLLPAPDLEPFAGDARASLLYYANWHFIDAGADYFRHDGTPSPFLHIWSLAIEEQLYVVLPVTLLALTAVARRWGRWVLPAGLGLLIAASVGLQVWQAGRSIGRAYYGTDTRAYQLLAGALLAVALHHHQRRTGRTGPLHGSDASGRADPRPAGHSDADRGSAPAGSGGGRSRLERLGWSGPAVPVAALALIGVLATDWWELSASARGLAVTVPVLVLLGCLAVDPRRGVARGLSHPLLAYLGRISYGTYLWHWPLIVVLAARTDLGPGALALVGGAGSTAAAAVSHRLLEMPVRRSGRLDRSPRLAVAGGVALAATLAVVVAPAAGGAWQDDKPQRIATAPAGEPNGPAGDEAVPSGAIEVDLADVRGDIPEHPSCFGRPVAQCVVVPGDGLAVHLMGDSHALMLLPALEAAAREGGHQLSVTVLGGCPWQRGLLYGVTDDHDNRCREQRPDWYERVLPAVAPDVIVVAQRAYDDPADPAPILAVDGRTDDRAALLDRATTEQVSSLRAEGYHLLLVEPIPIAPPEGPDPLVCLWETGAAAGCQFTTASDPTRMEQRFRSLAAADPEIEVLDLDRAVCPRHPICDPVVDDQVVRRDRDHLTATKAATLADPVAEAIEALIRT